MLVIACGPWSAELAATRGVELPVRPLCRQLLATRAARALPDDLPMVIEAETGFHFRRRGDRLVLAMTDPEPRWGFDEVVDETLFADRLERLAHRYPPAAGATIERAWAGLYDMTPDAHPIIGRGRRRRLRGLRLLAATASCSRPPSGARSPRRSSAASPSSTWRPYRLDALRGGRRLPGDARPLARTPRRPRESLPISSRRV